MLFSFPPLLSLICIPHLAPASSPLSLIAEGTDEDGEGVDLRIGRQDSGEVLGRDAVALQVGVAQHHHKVLVGLFSCQLLDAGVGTLQRVVAAHAELSVGVHSLQGEGGGGGPGEWGLITQREM